MSYCIVMPSFEAGSDSAECSDDRPSTKDRTISRLSTVRSRSIFSVGSSTISMTGWVGTLSLLDVASVLNGYTIHEDMYDFDAGRGFRHKLEQRCQTLATTVSLGVVLNVLFLIDNSNCRSVASSDAFK